jgi:hypothetical protein
MKSEETVIEDISAAAHKLWIDAKLKQNVDSYESDDGEELMVPYSELSEQGKEAIRANVLIVLAAIDQVYATSE